MSTNGMGAAFVGNDLIQRWITEGARVRVEDAGLQADLFQPEPTRMVRIRYGSDFVVISEQEFAALAYRLNIERKPRSQTRSLF